MRFILELITEQQKEPIMSNHTLYLLAVQVIEAEELTPGATYAEAFLAVAAYIEQHQKDVATLIVAMLEEV